MARVAHPVFRLCHYVPVDSPQLSDRCPGALRPHAAADGALVRLRVPGGRTSGPALAALGALSAEFGDGRVHLTSRGNLQIRGLADPLPDQFLSGLAAAGLLPSPTHERVRNVVASPLSGIAGGRADLRSLVPELDRLLCAEPNLAELSGRFLFGLDDGRGDIMALRPDVWASCLDAETARLGAAGFEGPKVPLAQVPAALIDLAHRFLRASGGLWNVRKLPDGGRGLLDSPQPRVAVDPEPMRYGAVGAGAASVLAPLGVLGPEQIAAAAAGTGDVVVTPWRGLVISGAADLEPLLRAGLVVDPGSPWMRITACIGAPGCAKSAGDTHAAARELAAVGVDRPTHVIGCERACGAPTFDHDRVVVRSAE